MKFFRFRRKEKMDSVMKVLMWPMPPAYLPQNFWLEPSLALASCA